MGKAKKRTLKLHMHLRRVHPDWTPMRCYETAIDIDQREQARLQAERWRKEWRQREQRHLHPRSQ